MPSLQTRPDETRVHVECHDVSKRYAGHRASVLSRWRGATDTPTVLALDGVSLTVDRGEIVGLSGPSGSGKSTLLHLVAGLEPPSTGRIVVGDDVVSSLSTSERTRYRRDHVGIVFQRFHLLPALTARANVALPLIERGVSTRERRERATSLLERVGLGDRVTHRPARLSGGEQQRVAIARALVTDPSLVIADEPTGELDTETGSHVLELFTDVATDRAVLLASHDRETLSIADRVVHLTDGRVTSSSDALPAGNRVQRQGRAQSRSRRDG